MLTQIHVVGPQEGHEHTHTIIFLHGKGSNCEEFAGEFFESEASEPAGQPRTLPDLFPTVRWVFPSAPFSESEMFNMRQWFDMESVQSPNQAPERQIPGLEQSIQLVLDVVEHEESLVPCEKIFLGGISQGFATVYSAYVSSDKTYAGLIGLCSWAPSAALRIINEAQNNASNPIGNTRRRIWAFLGHSQDDDVIPIEEGRKLRDTFGDRIDTKVEFHDEQEEFTRMPMGWYIP
ncbi:phospholipase/carboxylesterase [Hypoxylon rubiginosum]|uniref:Phospholipase/carboxylesterase n=1 Tax=Hypoxylon rubiginosum TaxID=110542 RepID=A0ACC0CU82_9PEZI|nr:phospholipase/carboxylesterase [Hypoxylon rubiginosum]